MVDFLLLVCVVVVVVLQCVVLVASVIPCVGLADLTYLVREVGARSVVVVGFVVVVWSWWSWSCWGGGLGAVVMWCCSAVVCGGRGGRVWRCWSC